MRRSSNNVEVVPSVPILDGGKTTPALFFAQPENEIANIKRIMAPHSIFSFIRVLLQSAQ